MQSWPETWATQLQEIVMSHRHSDWHSLKKKITDDDDDDNDNDKDDDDDDYDDEDEDDDDNDDDEYLTLNYLTTWTTQLPDSSSFLNP